MSQKQEETRSYEDYSLFDDIADDSLRIRNQGVVMRNIAVQGRSDTSKGKITSATAFTLMSYFSMIKPEDKGNVIKEFVKHCEADGFRIQPGG
jgi:hypothetical protein